MIDSSYLNQTAQDDLVEYMKEYLIQEKDLTASAVDMLYLDDFLSPWNWNNTPVLKGNSLREMAENFCEDNIDKMVDYLGSKVGRLPGYQKTKKPWFKD